MLNIDLLIRDPEGKPKLFYSVRELAAMVSLSRAAVYNQIKQGKLVSVKVGRKNLLKIDAIKDWLDAAPLSTTEVEISNKTKNLNSSYDLEKVRAKGF